MGLFKRLRRSPEERAWGAIRELENALKEQDADSKRPAGRQEAGTANTTGQGDTWEQWRPRLVQIGFGLAFVFAVLMAFNYVNDRFRKQDPYEGVDQRTFDALWGAYRPAEESPPVADERAAEVDEAPAKVDDSPAKPDDQSKHKPASKL